MRNLLTPFFILLGMLTACSTARFEATPQSQPTTRVNHPDSTEIAIPTPGPTTTSIAPIEKILILEPGPGSRVVSPILVSGMADPTFEQHLNARLLLDDGTELASATTTIQSEPGTRGAFTFEISFQIENERQAFIQVSSTSPRDGGIEHLDSIGVLLAVAEEPLIHPVETHPERIVIFQPIQGARISGGVAHIEGYAIASFEQTLVAQVMDIAGNIIGTVPLIVNSPDWGMPGPFSVDVPYELEVEGSGRIVVRDPSPAFNGDIHLASVDVNLSP